MKKGFIGPDSFFKNISAINSLGCGPNGLESISVKSSDTWRLSRNVVADVHRHLLDNSKDSSFVPKKAALPTDEAVKKILSLTPRNSKEIVQLAMAATLFNSKRPHSLFEAEAGTLSFTPAASTPTAPWSTAAGRCCHSRQRRTATLLSGFAHPAAHCSRAEMRLTRFFVLRSSASAPTGSSAWVRMTQPSLLSTCLLRRTSSCAPRLESSSCAFAPSALSGT